MLTLDVLLDQCKSMQIDLTHTLPKKSDSFSTALHEAAYRGNPITMKKLISDGADLFAKTRSGWLPIHSALLPKAPAYDDEQSNATWLLAQMKEMCKQPKDLSILITVPAGFAKHGDLDGLNRIIASVTSAASLEEHAQST